MGAASHWGRTPREAVAQECARRGAVAVADTCLALVREEPVPPEDLLRLAGPGARKFLDGGEHVDTYWLQVWGLRGLLWSWDDRATEPVREALGAEHWRVREMAAKVVARHLVGDAVPEVAALRDDPVPRVRSAAARALVRLTQLGA